MEWLSFEGVNWWAVLVAFVAVFALGSVWYSRLMFFPVWSRLESLDDEKMRNANMPLVFGQMLVGNALGVLALAWLMAGLEITGWWDGLLFGLLVGVAFRAGAFLVHNGFAQRHPLVTLIDSGHDAVSLALAGVILGVWV